MQRVQPGKAPGASPVREPLSYLLGTRAKVACLRVLAASTELLTQREVARRAGVQHRSAQLALEDLTALGVARRIEGGRDFLVGFNNAYELGASLRAIFNAEAGFFLALRQRLARIATDAPRGARITSLVLFGSVARGDDQPGSDLDLLVITRNADATEIALARINAAAEEIRTALGYMVRPIAYTVTDARSRWRRREPPFPEILSDHIVLAGPTLRELLDG
ncbi:MAG: nucleotidyltransferase domain-containing protein [Gemmatimonadota bacterium]